MQLTLPNYILSIPTKLTQAGYEVYLVGGSVRNLLLEKEVKDWDLTTNATPEEILQLFPDGFYDNVFGTVGLALEKIDPELTGIVEITTFRTEQGFTDRRHPEKISWGKTIEEDLQRRDFTMN